MYYILLLNIASAIVKPTVGVNCDACILGNCFKKNLIYEGAYLNNVVVNRRTNELFFQANIGKNTSRFIKVLHNMDTKETRRLDNITEIKSAAFNEETGELYLAPKSNGDRNLILYRNGTYQNLGLKDLDIFKIQYVNRLYFSRTTKGICQKDGMNVTCYEALNNVLVEDFAVDKNYDIFYRNSSGIYKFQRPNKIFLVHTPYPLELVRLAVNKRGELHYSIDNKIWKYNYVDSRFDEIGLVANAHIGENTFGRDNNLFYCDRQFGLPDKLYKLSMNPGVTCIYDYNDINDISVEDID